MMIPVLIVMPGIIPTTNPSKEPVAVAIMLIGRLACRKPSKISGFMRSDLQANPEAALLQIHA